MTDAGESYVERPPIFRVDVDTGEISTRVAICGEVDLSTADAIEYKIASARDQSELRHLVVDLREVTFMDSTGLRLLLSLRTHSGRNGYRLTIVRSTHEAFRAIQIAGLEQVLTFVDDPADSAIE